jgi:DNA helicase-2/ATP-dependent DNA helicase PcrA
MTHTDSAKNISAQQLNAAQQKAVETTEGPLLIIAGAGSGKTKVITHRILNLMKRGAAPQSILAITFTNKAANEMKDRVIKLLSEDAGLNRPISVQERPLVSTFHALGVHIIRENARLLNLTRHFTIYDRGDSRRAIKESLEQCSIDPKTHDPSAILNLISRAKGDGMTRLEYFDAAKGYMEETTANVWEKYENILAKEKALDFDDLLAKTAQLLEKNSDVRKHYGGIWKYIHVDEYQDTNKIQYKITKLLTQGQIEMAEDGHKQQGKDGRGVGFVANICVVGDIDQNIYSWRGATIDNILNFEKDYPDATVITLEKNYRSTKTILAAANSVIEKNKVRRKKNLYTDNGPGEKISLIVSYSEADEARAIADKARELIEKDVSPKEIAVLYRTNFQSRVLEESFIKKQIPYQLLGVKFFERKEVKDVISYIRAALNRDSWGDIARIINMPPRGIGKVTLAKIVNEMGSGSTELGIENDAPGTSKALPAITPAVRAKITSFWKLLDDIREEIAEKKPSEAVKFVIQETGIERLYREGTGGDEERLLNVRELVTVAAQYDYLNDDKSNQMKAIEAFLENAALATDQDELKEDSDAVKLMTVHAAKGLEFEYVFIAGLEQDLFPFKHVDDADIDSSEEERRLFYVALTRAKKKLFLSNAIIRTIYGAQRVSAPSEFIEDIEKELLDEVAPEKPSGAKAIFIDF